jgi:coenzyme PQQ precursor peptide PqqA
MRLRRRVAARRLRHSGCLVAGLVGVITINAGEHPMRWTKPEFEVVDVTMEVTAYVARK